MTQFPTTPPSNPYAYDYSEAVVPKKTSGMAITALVLSIVGIVPCCGAITAPIGFLLGAIAAFMINARSEVKGRGMAIAAAIIGLILTVAQISVMVWGYNTIMGPVMRGPVEAMQAGFSGNMAEVKSQFHGSGATASDDEVKVFFDTLRARYGELQSIEFDPQQNSSSGQPSVVFRYRFHFANGTQNGVAERIFAEEGRQGGFVNKWGYIEIADATQGNVRFPVKPHAPAITNPSATPPASEQPETPEEPEGTGSDGAGHE